MSQSFLSHHGFRPFSDLLADHSLCSVPFFYNIFVKDSLTPAVLNVLLCLLAKAFAMGAVLRISRWTLLLKAALSVHLNKKSPAVFTL